MDSPPRSGVPAPASVRRGFHRVWLFVTTKLWVQDTGEENTKKAFGASLQRLGLDYLNLYLIHQPYGDYYGSSRAMPALNQQGLVKAIGVANFYPDRLVDLADRTGFTPAVNQIETHPYFQPAGRPRPHGRARGPARVLGRIRRRPQQPVRRPRPDRDRRRARQVRRSGRAPLADGDVSQRRTAHRHPESEGRVIATWPSFALIAAYELLMRQVRRSAAASGTAQRPAARLR